MKEFNETIKRVMNSDVLLLLPHGETAKMSEIAETRKPQHYEAKPRLKAITVGNKIFAPGDCFLLSLFMYYCFPRNFVVEEVSSSRNRSSPDLIMRIKQDIFPG